MSEVGIRELKQHTSEVIRKACETKEAIAVTRHGKVVAWLVPATQRDEAAKVKAMEIWAKMDDLAKEIGTRWPVGVSAVEAVHEQRREL